jgi:hypothetical protein
MWLVSISIFLEPFTSRLEFIMDFLISILIFFPGHIAMRHFTPLSGVSLPLLQEYGRTSTRSSRLILYFQWIPEMMVCIPRVWLEKQKSVSDIKTFILQRCPMDGV